MATVYRVVGLWTGITGSPFANVIHFDTTGGTAQQAVTAARTFLLSNQGQISSNLSLSMEPEVKIIDTSDGQVVGSTTTTSSSAAGSSGTELLPQGTSLKCTFRTGVYVAGREVRGGVFIPGITETYNGSGGMPDSTVMAALTGGLNTLIADANSLVVVYRRVSGIIPPVSGGGANTKWSRLLSRRS